MGNVLDEAEIVFTTLNSAGQDTFKGTDPFGVVVVDVVLSVPSWTA